MPTGNQPPILSKKRQSVKPAGNFAHDFCRRQGLNFEQGAVIFVEMLRPKEIQLIGQEVAILWEDGTESFYPMDLLRERSPSAETRGEVDVLGNRYGGDGRQKFPGVTVTGWEMVGGYAVRFLFSDGHGSGIYSFKYLKELEKAS